LAALRLRAAGRGAGKPGDLDSERFRAAPTTNACNRGTIDPWQAAWTRRVFVVAWMGARAAARPRCQDETPRLYGVTGERRRDVAARGACAATGENCAHRYPRRRADVAGLPTRFA